MANSRTKRKKYSNDDHGKKSGVYEVEEVIGYKLVRSELKFYIKWKGFAGQTWEPTENLVHCSVFRDFVNEKFKSLEKDIYVNSCNIKQRLKKQMRQKMSQPKVLSMMDVFPFDPFEFKVIQVFFHLLPPDGGYKMNLERMVIKNHFFKLDQVQRIQHDSLIEQINLKEKITVIIENDEDFDLPPTFEYITKNILISDDDDVDDIGTTLGCKCKVCTKDSDCCPQQQNEPFPYKVERSGRVSMDLNQTRTIIECGDLCLCGSKCINRVSQGNKDIPLCLFKTNNRGWGIRSLTNIFKGTFITEYVGELIKKRKADIRLENSYLFDQRRSISNQFYKISASNYGNLSRFVNHSCEPNASVLFVNNCQSNQRSQKICFFANRKITKGEEITIDYNPGLLRGETSQANKSVHCLCGTKSCRKFIY